MWKVDLPQPEQLVTVTKTIARGSPLTSSIQCQHSGFIKWRSMKSAGRVRYMVLYKMPAIRPIGSRSFKACLQMMWCPTGQVARSIDDRSQEKWVPRGFPFSRDWMCAWLQGERYCCLLAVITRQQKRVVRVSNVIDIHQGNTSLSQAVVDSVNWRSRTVIRDTLNRR